MISRKNKFAIGDLLKLKSGGPDMAVKSLPTQTSQLYTCQWFAGKKLEQGSFPEDSLELIDK